jgi:nicotinate-nucleotide--dimethylbenzimidazole phosphoribosyltransferase
MLKEQLAKIQPVSESWIAKARTRLDTLTKPRGSLGFLEDLAARYVAIREEEPPVIGAKEVFVFVGDHDVVAEGVSAYPQEVTALMVRNFLTGGACINVLARCAAAKVSIVDVGMIEDLPQAPDLIRRNVARGARNIAAGPAMTLHQAEAAIAVGLEMAERASADGSSMIATGEMGIGNTTPSTALFAHLLPASLKDLTGRGTGLDEQGVRAKSRVIQRALKINQDSCGDPLAALAALGGLEIAAICGLCLGGAANRLAVVVDGFISSAGALVAMRLRPEVGDYLFFSHQSLERGHQVFFQKERIRPIVDLDMRLGEGTGAVIGMQILEDAVRVYNEMATFQEVGIEPGA